MSFHTNTCAAFLPIRRANSAGGEAVTHGTLPQSPATFRSGPASPGEPEAQARSLFHTRLLACALILACSVALAVGPDLPEPVEPIEICMTKGC